MFFKFEELINIGFYHKPRSDILDRGILEKGISLKSRTIAQYKRIFPSRNCLNRF
jgi:hypothetical protein